MWISLSEPEVLCCRCRRARQETNSSNCDSLKLSNRNNCHSSFPWIQWNDDVIPDTMKCRRDRRRGLDPRCTVIFRCRFPQRSSLTCYLLLFICFLDLCLLTPSSLAAPLPVKSDKNKTSDSKSEWNHARPQVNGEDYLMTFGYLPQSDLETGALRTDEELRKAIRRLQAFAKIPITGKMDDRTREQMQRPRCGMADYLPDDTPTGRAAARRKRYAFAPSKWKKNGISFRILNYTPDLSLSQAREAIISAFHVWGEVTNIRFGEIMVPQDGVPDIKMRFSRGYHGDGYPFDGRGLTLAHAFYPGDGDRNGDVHFDEDETWSHRSHKGTDLFAVAAHEIGHALGLAHSSVEGSLMYPWYQGYNPDFRLHTDDIVAIQYLYGGTGNPFPPRRPPPPRTPANPGYTVITKRPSPTRRPFTVKPRTTTTTTTQRLPSNTAGTGKPKATVAPPTGSTEVPPDPCTTSIDALAVIRGEIFLFKDRWFWRRDENGIVAGFPVEIDRFWYGFPLELDGVDAVYERPGDGKIVFFKGNRFWLFNGNHLVAGFPATGRPITELGFPPDIKKVDAAFIWGYNGKTYFISGDMYWRYDERHGHMDYDYPRDMSMWKGVPLPVDSAFKFWDGRTYFFHGKQYWQFNDARMAVRTKGYPKQIGDMWMKCGKENQKNKNKTIFKTAKWENDPNSGGHLVARTDIFLAAVLLLWRHCM